MKFLCLCHYNRAKFAACTKQDFEAVQRICEPHDASLQASGHLVAVGSLADASGDPSG